MGLFRRWFGGAEQRSGEAVAGPAAPDTLEQPGRRNAASEESAKSDIERGEDAHLREKIQYLLDTAINPAVAGHGGMVSLVDVRDRMVYLQMGGGCQGCGMADVTLKQGIELMIREEVPEVVEILDVTDHAAGQNPYSGASKK